MSCSIGVVISGFSFSKSCLIVDILFRKNELKSSDSFPSDVHEGRIVSLEEPISFFVSLKSVFESEPACSILFENKFVNSTDFRFIHLSVDLKTGF